MKKTKTLNIQDLALLKTNPQKYYNLVKSYSHAPHLAELPYDRNSRELAELGARYLKIKKQESHYLKDVMEKKKEIDSLYQQMSEAQVKAQELFEESWAYNRKTREWSVLNEQMGDEKGDDIDELVEEFESVEGYHRGLAKRLWKIRGWWYNATDPEERWVNGEPPEYNYLADRMWQSKYGIATDEQKEYIQETVAEMKRISGMTRFKDTIDPKWIDRVENLASDNYGKHGPKMVEFNKVIDDMIDKRETLWKDAWNVRTEELRPLEKDWAYLTKYWGDASRDDKSWYMYCCDHLESYAGEKGRTVGRFNYVTGNEGNSFEGIEKYIKETNLENYVNRDGKLTDEWYELHGDEK